MLCKIICINHVMTLLMQNESGPMQAVALSGTGVDLQLFPNFKILNKFSYIVINFQ